MYVGVSAAWAGVGGTKGWPPKNGPVRGSARGTRVVLLLNPDALNGVTWTPWGWDSAQMLQRGEGCRDPRIGNPRVHVLNFVWNRHFCSGRMPYLTPFTQSHGLALPPGEGKPTMSPVPLLVRARMQEMGGPAQPGSKRNPVMGALPYGEVSPCFRSLLLGLFIHFALNNHWIKWINGTRSALLLVRDQWSLCMEYSTFPRSTAVWKIPLSKDSQQIK